MPQSRHGSVVITGPKSVVMYASPARPVSTASGAKPRGPAPPGIALARVTQSGGGRGFGQGTTAMLAPKLDLGMRSVKLSFTNPGVTSINLTKTREEKLLGSGSQAELENQ